MPRWRNHYPDNHFHFFTAGFVNRVPLLLETALCRELLTIWGTCRARSRFAILGYVLMPDHFHLLTHFELGVEARHFHRDANHRFAQRVIEHLRETGHHSQWLHSFFRSASAKAASRHRVFEREPRNLAMASRAMVEQKLNYIHMNPVRKGLVEDPAEWPWSSAGAYLRQAEGPLRVDIEAFPPM